MSKTKVIYKDVAPGAAENAQLSATGASEDSNLDLLPFGVEPEPVYTLEPDHWRLNGTFRPMETQKLGLWSKSLSDANGKFEADPIITIKFTNQYSSTGITLVFDRATGGYCTAVNIKWYQGETLKANVDFYPDSITYFCEQAVKSYDQIIITFQKTSLPYRYVKVEHIIFGLHRTFGMSELRNASVINEMDGIAETLPISTFKWKLDSREDVNFMFQLKQPVEILNDANLLGVYYIEKHNRKTERIYDIECSDAIGVLDGNSFAGSVYTDKSAMELLAEIIGSDFVIEYAENVTDTTLTGVLLQQTKRSAAQQVLFAWGVCMATDGGKTLRVFNLDTSLTEIGKDQTFYGVSVETDSIVTEVRLTAHEYAENANGTIEIGGVKYSDTTTVYSVSNPNVNANDKQNVKEYTDCTLVSPANAQAVVQRIYDWLLRRNTAKADIVWKGEALGDYVSFPNSWGGSNPGSITKMEIKLSNTVVAKCEAVGQ